MRTRPNRPAWALLPAVALFACSFLGALPSRADDGPAGASETVSILDAQKSGDLAVSVRGRGADHVKFTVKNNSSRRLNVVLPPGLVAAASTGQGFQSMGLGTPTTQPGRFGAYSPGAKSPKSETVTGFRSMPPVAPEPDGVAVPAGQAVEFNLPSVCLNFGVPTPTPRDVFTLMDVADYSRDARAQKALRSLALLGTSQGVAQSVAWHVFNGMTYQQMAKLASNYINPLEISVAARFVEALDASGTHELVDPAYFREGRVLARVRGEGTMGKVAVRLSNELQGSQIFGLPVQVVDELNPSTSRPGSVLLDVILTADKSGRTQARSLVLYNDALGGWVRLGGVDLGRDLDVTRMSGETLASTLDHAVAAAFVTATPARRGTGVTTLRIVNKLPLTVESVVVRTGKSDDAPVVTLDGLGIGPRRNATATIEAPLGLVERVALNGL